MPGGDRAGEAVKRRRARRSVTRTTTSNRPLSTSAPTSAASLVRRYRGRPPSGFRLWHGVMLWAGIVDHLILRQVTWHCRARITPTIKERAVPTNLYERGTGAAATSPRTRTRGSTRGSFLLDQTACRRATAARGARNRIGWAVQLSTIRNLGTFLNNSET
ncbi:DUF4158 domain-containing protein [Streptomyces nigra]